MSNDNSGQTPPAEQAPPPPAYAAPAPGYPGQAPAPGYAAPPAPGYGAYPAAGQAYAPAAPTNTLAVVSMIAGIAGIVILPIIASIAAIITGHMALSKLKTSGEQGRGMAMAGLIMGYVGVAFGVLFVILMFALFLPWLASIPGYR